MEQVTKEIRDLFGSKVPTEEELSTIAVWANKALELQAEIEQAEAHLAELNKELAQIEERDLPKAMMTAGTMEFKLTNGGKITIKDVIQGGLTKDEEKRKFVFDWVIDNGGKENIKDHFEIDYTRGQYSYALAFRKLLQENQIHFNEFESIHVQTLWAFLREKMEEGVLPPFDKMGLRFFKKAVIKVPEKKEKKDADDG
jgi:hypothetical protein